MSLFLARVHGGNYLPAYLCSWFGTVYFAKPDPRLPRALLKPFQRIRFEEVFSSDEWEQLRDEAWAEWAKLVPHARSNVWQAPVAGLMVDFYRVALTRLCKDYLLHYRLVKYVERTGFREARITNSLTMRVLRRIARGNGLDIDGQCKVGRGWWFCDLVYSWAQWTACLFEQVWFAFARRVERYTVEILHEGLTASEYGADPHELSFSWVKRRNVCRPGQVLFVLPRRQRLKHETQDILRRETMLKGLGWQAGLRAAWHGVRCLAWGWLRAFQPETGLLTEFQIRSIAPYLLAEERRIRMYLTTVSAANPMDPSVAVYNAMGIRTILWAYSANLSLFNHSYHSAWRYLHLAHLETNECWLWSEHHMKLWRQSESLAPRGEFRLLGPVMMADASPCLMKSSDSRSRFLKLTDDNAMQRTVAVFDITPTTKAWQQSFGCGPPIITKELVDVFYRDLMRLLEAFPHIRFLIKTKRGENEYKKKTDSQKQLVDPAGAWVQRGRVITLSPQISPYIPMGAADLCMGLPFTSPVIAGLHFGRRGIYHDPLRSALQHHHHDLDEIISHGYEELEKKVRYWLYECSEETFQVFLNRPETRRFLGPHPGTDPAEEFGKALWGKSFTLPPVTGFPNHQRDEVAPWNISKGYTE